MLSFLFSRPVPGVALVVSYRADDLHRRHPLRRQVAEWMRLRGVERLAASSRSPTTTYAASSARSTRPRCPRPSTSPSSTAPRATRSSSRSSSAPRGPARSPASSPTCCSSTSTASTRPPDASCGWSRSRVARSATSLLAAVSDLGSAELEAALRTAVESHVLVASRGGTYAFRHALLGEAVYDDLLPGERMRLHAAFVAALGEGRAVGTAAELAQHARRADDRPVAVRASIEAGEEALAVGGPAEAATHFLDALELVDTAREPLPDVDAFALARRCAEALVASGRVPKAVKVLRARLAAPAGRGCRRRPRTAPHGPGLGAAAHRHHRLAPRDRGRGRRAAPGRPAQAAGPGAPRPRAEPGRVARRRGAERRGPGPRAGRAQRPHQPRRRAPRHGGRARPRGRCEPERRLAGRGRAGAAGRADRARAPGALPARPAPPRRGRPRRGPSRSTAR